ncbi:hypothetical protein [Sandaracinus amylolyticus]|uniref:Uncharacterized protein n=1 Tax=Sandaracinus amylolyticus TaxID=927083 RepID=A0A0F6W6C1_9BACT|nr:hypothetical protein [Sandaracinus amylolyticus]AKF08600.1 hypothetical protein DB32_005749 [Sandaracinus amylolyticus]
MEIFLDKRAVKQIRTSAQDAIDEGDTDTLREDIIEAFSDDQIEEIERRVDSVDFNDFISEVLDEWSGDEVDELFELIEGHLSEAGIDVKYATAEADDEEEEEVEDEDEDEDEDEEDDDVFVEDTEEEL